MWNSITYRGLFCQPPSKIIGGGGGGGGVVAQTNVANAVVLEAGTMFSLSIGAGGVPNSGNGQASVLELPDRTLTAYGGGGGGSYNSATPTGLIGSQGGKASSATGGSSPLQGMAGGANEGTNGGGGGGGDSQKGGDGSTSKGGNGGEGFASYLTGEKVVYGSGGGGGTGNFGVTGGKGGTNAADGANKADRFVLLGAPAGFGGGGGGGRYLSGQDNGSAGGSGAVVLAFTIGDTISNRIYLEDVEPVAWNGTGTAIPELVVKTYGGETLTAADYTVSYDGNNAYGMASVTVTAKAPYSGAMTKTFLIRHRYYVADGATGVGTGWGAETSLKNALDLAIDKDEIWMKADECALTEAITCSKAVLIRGGFAGTEVSANARTTASRTVFDGGRTLQNMFQASLGAGELILDGIEFARAKHGALRFSGDGNLSLTNCVFTDNVNVAPSDYQGGALSVIGSQKTGTIRLTNCEFRGNVYRTGNHTSGTDSIVTDVRNVGRVYMDSCLFVTNGISPAFAGQQAGYLPGAERCQALYYFSGAPLTARNTRFLGNRSGINDASETGSHIYFCNTAAACCFTNCLFSGNASHNTMDMGSTVGSLINMNGSSTAAPLVISGCTFGYNVADTLNSACAVTVAKGALTVRDSVFYGNLGTFNRTYGVDIHIASGTADIDYSLFSGKGMDNITGVEPEEIGEHIIVGDPLFVTPFATFAATLENTVGKAATVYGVTRVNNTAHYSPKASADLIHYDLHLQSAAGRWTGSAWTTDEASSIAIDSGDPDADFANEPSPNGGVRNLGFYGNTAEASKSPIGQPAFDGDVTIDQTIDEYSQPYFKFTLGGDDSYIAMVKICFGPTDGGNDESAWGFVRTASVAAGPGESFSTGAQTYFNKNDTIYYRVTLTGKDGKHTYKEGSFTVVKNAPPWYGRGDKSGRTIHVWAEAVGDGTGRDWANAVASLEEAVGILATDATKSEIWLATDVTRKIAPSVLTITRPVTIRGGFTHMENTADERAASAVTVFDGASSFGCLEVHNVAKTTLDRLLFRRANRRAVVKTGAGDLVLDSCRFEDCIKSGGATHNGGALAATGSSGSTCLMLTNCVFAGNVNSVNGNTFQVRGFTAFINEFKRVTMDDCLFVTNGVANSLRTAQGGSCPSAEGKIREVGGTFYFENAPLTARNCRFVGNLSAIGRNMGTLLEFEKNCGGTALTNCLFLGNCTTETYDLGSPVGACVAIYDDSATRTYEFVNCTFAYNTSASKLSSAALMVYKGAAKVRNSIFFGNLIRGGTPYGADLHVETGLAEVNYTLFTALGTDNITKSANASITTNNVFAADPLLVTAYETDVLPSLVSGNLKVTPTGVRGPAANFALSASAGYADWNAHLRTRHGYTDETTGEVVKFTRAECPENSPAIDAGDPKADFSREPEPNGRCVNLGFYGNTPWASMSPGGLLLYIR